MCNFPTKSLRQQTMLTVAKVSTFHKFMIFFPKHQRSPLYIIYIQHDCPSQINSNLTLPNLFAIVHIKFSIVRDNHVRSLWVRHSGLQQSARPHIRVSYGDSNVWPGGWLQATVGSGHRTVTVLLPGFAINWQQNQVTRQPHLCDWTHIITLHNINIYYYYQVSNISHTKSQNWNVSRVILQLSLHNLLKPLVCLCENEDVVGASPVGATPTTSVW